MKDEILKKVYETDTAPIPRYRLVDSEGKTLIEGIEIQLQNLIDQEGTPYNAQSVLPDDLAQMLCPDSENPTPAEALRALKSLTDTDRTLSVAGKAADAEATGEALAGKAPAGYGLGGEAEQKDWSEVDSITANGTYRFAGIHQTINGIYVTSATMLVINFGGSYCTQILRTVENASGHYKSYTLVRSKGAIGWDGWECPDPPMQVGVEYRTTERRVGKPVYTKLIEIGQLPNNSTKTVSTGVAASRIFRSDMSAYNNSADAHSPVLYHNFAEQIANYILVGTNVTVTTNHTDFVGYSGSVQIWYV